MYVLCTCGGFSRRTNLPVCLNASFLVKLSAKAVLELRRECGSPFRELWYIRLIGVGVSAIGVLKFSWDWLTREWVWTIIWLYSSVTEIAERLLRIFMHFIFLIESSGFTNFFGGWNIETSGSCCGCKTWRFLIALLGGVNNHVDRIQL